MSEKRSFRSAVVLACGSWVAHLLATAAVCVVMMIGVPHFVEFFMRNGIELPSATRLVINLSNYFLNFYYTLLVPLCLDAALLVGLNFSPPKVSWLARTWSSLVLLFAAFFLAFCVLALAVAVEEGPERLE